MKNYRIQKLSYGDYVRYVPQQKVFGLFWWNVFNDDFAQYHSYEKAKKALCSYLKGLVVENLDVDCGENK
jgi:hypothetical protein